MKKIFVSLTVAMLLFAIVASVAYAAADVHGTSVSRQLAQVRRATAKYRDVNAALADGFIAAEHCVAEPGKGGMGFHYINPERIMDGKINLLEPEVLLYGKTKHGLKLLGVEYFQGIGAPDAPIPDPAPAAPRLFGRAFDGPMLGHEPGMPPHYDLHVWLYKSNPSGIFAPYNPKVSCQ